MTIPGAVIETGKHGEVIAMLFDVFQMRGESVVLPGIFWVKCRAVITQV